MSCKHHETFKHTDPYVRHVSHLSSTTSQLTDIYCSTSFMFLFRSFPFGFATTGAVSLHFVVEFPQEDTCIPPQIISHLFLPFANVLHLPRRPHLLHCHWQRQSQPGLRAKSINEGGVSQLSADFSAGSLILPRAKSSELKPKHALRWPTKPNPPRVTVRPNRHPPPPPLLPAAAEASDQRLYPDILHLP